MNRQIYTQVLAAIGYILLQVLVLKNMALFDVGFCFLYVLFILSLSLGTSPSKAMIWAFVIGIILDIFNNYIGLHAFATVLLAYVRNHWVNVITPHGGYDSSLPPTIRAYGKRWYIIYSMPLVFIHHTSLFFLEIAGFQLFWHTMAKVFFSTLLTTTTILIVQYLFTRSRKP